MLLFLSISVYSVMQEILIVCRFWENKEIVEVSLLVQWKEQNVLLPGQNVRRARAKISLCCMNRETGQTQPLEARASCKPHCLSWKIPGSLWGIVKHSATRMEQAFSLTWLLSAKAGSLPFLWWICFAGNFYVWQSSWVYCNLFVESLSFCSCCHVRKLQKGKII